MYNKNVHAFGGDKVDKKYRQILTILLNNDYVKVQEISVSLKKTNRTVRNYMNELNHILNEHGARIQTYYNKGYHLEVFDEREFDDFVSLIQYTNQDYNVSENRIIEIFSQLFFEHHYIKQSELEEQFCISTKQLKEDLYAIKELLKQYHLSIQVKPHYGMYVSGEEYQKRLCISHFNSVYGDNLYYRKLEEYHSLKESVKNIVLTCIANKSYQISDDNLANLVSHITLSIIRASNDDLITFSDDMVVEQNSMQYSIALNIIEMLNKVLGLALDKNEVKYVTIQLLSKESKILENNQKISHEIERLIGEMLMRIKKNFGVDFVSDLNLLLSLNQHLIPLISRIRYKTFIHNPLTEEIKVKLWHSYEMAVVACEAINEKYHIILPEDEIAFIALHVDLAYNSQFDNVQKKNILIICSSGIGTARLLEANFKRRFSPSIQHLDVAGINDLSKLDLHSYDCIFTTVQIHIETDIPVIKIDNVIGNDDYEKISNELYQIRQYKKYLNKQLIFTRYLCSTKDECIHKMIESAKKYYHIPEVFEEMVLKRETLGSTEFGSIMALPHSLYPITEDTFIAIAVLEKPIFWNKQKVSIVILLSVSKNQKQSELDEVYYMISTLLSHRVLQGRMLRCQNASQIVELIGEYL